MLKVVNLGIAFNSCDVVCGRCYDKYLAPMREMLMCWW